LRKALVTLTLALGLAAAPAVAGAGDATCKKPGEKTLVRVNLKPDTEVADMVGWYANLTCTTVLMGASVTGKKVTILAPEPITLAEARRLFYNALDSVGLTAEQSGKFLQIVEARKARPKIFF
jgi:hypothetical protein